MAKITKKKTTQVKGLKDMKNKITKMFTKSPTKKNYERKIKERKNLIPIYEKRFKAQEKRIAEFEKKRNETNKKLTELVALKKRKETQLETLKNKIKEKYYDGKELS